MSYPRIAVLALVTGAIAVSGCGGSSKATSTSASQNPTTGTTASTTPTTGSTEGAASSSTTASGAPLTRAVLIAKAEPICAHLNTQLAANTVKTAKELAHVLVQAAAYEQTEYVQLSALVPPTSMASDWKQFLANTKKWFEDSAKLGGRMEANNLNAALPLQLATKKSHEQIVTIAKHDGIKACDATV